MTHSAQPILYSFRRCPYAMRARLAIVASQQPVELREILLRDKPAEMLAASPKGTVPVLVLGDDQVLEESLDIMLWTLKRNDPHDWLSPEQGALEDMLVLIEEMDGDFKHHLDHYKYATRHAGPDQDETAYAHEHRTAATTILTRLDQRLANQPYLFGSRKALADMATAPFVRQFANTDRDWFDAQNLPHLQAWLREFLDQPLFTSIMAKYKPWAPGNETPPFPPAL